MITDNELLYVIDSTKAKQYMECPRSFFFKYVLGWETDGSNLNLVFGEAMHKLMEHLAKTGYTVDAINAGMVDFNRIYRKHFPNPLEDDSRAPKNPVYAEMAAINYCQHYKDDHERFEFLHTEVGGSVLVLPAAHRGINKLFFKIDTVIYDRQLDQFRCLEHKTTGRSHSLAYANQWPLSFQVGTYTNVLRTFYPPEQVFGVTINSISLLKTKFDYKRYPVRMTDANMEVWFDIADRVLFDIEEDLKCVFDEQADPGLTLSCFPMNPTSCDRWFGCPYLDFCQTYPNPLLLESDYADEPPEGFRQHFWDPRAIEVTERLTTNEETTDANA